MDKKKDISFSFELYIIPKFYVNCNNHNYADKRIVHYYFCWYQRHVDVQNEDTYGPAVKVVEDIVRDQGLNVLINNAGINCGATARYSKLNRQQMAEVFDVNAIAPTRVTEVI